MSGRVLAWLYLTNLAQKNFPRSMSEGNEEEGGGRRRKEEG